MSTGTGETREYAEAQVDKVLADLTGAHLYADNVFRTTGLPIDATPRQIRRKREEAAIGTHMIAAVDPTAEPAPLPPSTDPDALNIALESMHRPILRFIHELLWINGSDASHDAAVRQHCTALDNDETTTSIEFAKTLSHWWRVLDDGGIWERARQRVRELNDPQLPVTTIRVLADRFPAFLAQVHATIAANAAENDDEPTAYRHLRALQRSTIPEEVVTAALRSAVMPAERAIDRICESSLDSTNSDLGAQLSDDILTETRGKLAVVTILLSEEHMVAREVRNQVANMVNFHAIKHFNKHRDSWAILELLEEARQLATVDSLKSIIDSNLVVVRSVAGVRRLSGASEKPRPSDSTRPYAPDYSPPFDADSVDAAERLIRRVIADNPGRTPETLHDRVRHALGPESYTVQVQIYRLLTERRILAAAPRMLRFVRFNPMGISHLRKRHYRTAEQTGEPYGSFITTSTLLCGLIPLRSYIVEDRPDLLNGGLVTARRVAVSRFARWYRVWVPVTILAVGLWQYAGWHPGLAFGLTYLLTFIIVSSARNP